MTEIQPASRAERPYIRQIYMEAFPREERKPFWLIRRHMRHGKMELLSVVNDGAPVGLAITATGRSVVLLDYFAIEAGRRDGGLGSAALAALLQRYEGKQFFLEIESTEIPSDNQAQRLSRKAFYLRNGLQDTGLRMSLFGVDMELLSSPAGLDWPACSSIYRLLYGPDYTDHVVLTGYGSAPGNCG